MTPFYSYRLASSWSWFQCMYTRQYQKLTVSATIVLFDDQQTLIGVLPTESVYQVYLLVLDYYVRFYNICVWTALRTLRRLRNSSSMTIKFNVKFIKSSSKTLEMFHFAFIKQASGRTQICRVARAFQVQSSIGSVWRAFGVTSDQQNY